MATLRQEIEALLCAPETDDTQLKKGTQFVPYESLYRLLTEDKVLQTVKEVDQIQWYLKTPTTDWIMNNGRRIFAILVILQGKEPYISNFMQSDKFDEHLPFTEHSLSTIVPGIANEFYAAQWEFAAPKLVRDVIHRVLQPDQRLPFILNKKFDSGGFGDIYKIIIHPDHQTVPLLPNPSDQQLIRKEFKPPRKKRDPTRPNARDDREEHSNELRTLSILNELKHPNIIQILTSYTHDGRHNLIFPLVKDGNLEALFREARPTQFDSDEKFLTALCGLSSAIEEVHFYTLARLKIEMLGCHHDLKPKNILVCGTAFVLADFGLSKLKEASDSSKSLYEGGGGNYLAPECEDHDDGFERHSVNRSSDIWSFGCIIAEILTFMRGGPESVQDFRSRRTVKIGNARMASFHHGIRTPNQAALDWISNLQKDSDEFSKPLIQLIRSMMEIEPDGRPNAHTVTSRLRLITVQAHASLVGSLYSGLVSKLPNSFDAHSEWARFKSWRSVFDDATNCDQWSQQLEAQMDLMSTVRNLDRLQEELKSIISRCGNQLSPLFTTLRSLQDKLYQLLPKDMRMQAKAKWEIEMTSSEELDDLEEVQRAFEESLTNSRISTLAKIKRMSIIAAQQGKEDPSDLEVDPKLVELVGTCGNHTLALLESEVGDSKTRIFIEWIKYSNHETENFPRLLSRIKKLASLLHSFPGPDDFRTLRCSAFIHEPGESAFGLIYDYPCQEVAAPKTLARILEETASYRERPTLESRYRLATTLAVSLSGFHGVGWLHKGISPYNILFFLAKGSKATGWLKEPYLTGFNHSRQDDPLAFTAGPSTDELGKKYYHPDYVHMHEHQVWYAPRFDYYSLGLVLLEIGLWETVEKMVAGKSCASNQEKMLDYIRNKKVPILGHYMGTVYQNTVLSCLNGFQNDAVTGPEDAKSSRVEFEKRVVQPLKRCYADQ